MDWNYGSVIVRFCVQKSVQEAVGGPGDNRAAASSIWIKLVFLTLYLLASPGTTSNMRSFVFCCIRLHWDIRVLLFSSHNFSFTFFWSTFVQKLDGRRRENGPDMDRDRVCKTIWAVIWQVSCQKAFRKSVDGLKMDKDFVYSKACQMSGSCTWLPCGQQEVLFHVWCELFNHLFPTRLSEVILFRYSK